MTSKVCYSASSVPGEGKVEVAEEIREGGASVPRLVLVS